MIEIIIIRNRTGDFHIVVQAESIVTNGIYDIERLNDRDSIILDRRR